MYLLFMCPLRLFASSLSSSMFSFLLFKLSNTHHTKLQNKAILQHANVRARRTRRETGEQFTKVMCLFAIAITSRSQTSVFTVKNLKQPIFALFCKSIANLWFGRIFQTYFTELLTDWQVDNQCGARKSFCGPCDPVNAGIQRNIKHSPTLVLDSNTRFVF